MSIDRTSGSRETDFQQLQRQDAKGGSGFAAAMKKEQAAKDDQKAQDAKEADAKKPADEDKGKDAKKTDGKGKKEGEGEGGAVGRHSGKHEPVGERKGKGEGKAGGEGKGEGQGKGAGLGTAKGKGKGEELGEIGKADSLGSAKKSGEFSAVLSRRGKEAEQVKQTNQKDDIAAAKRIDKPGEVSSAKLSEKQDAKSMQEEIAKHMFPGEIAHPFLLQVQQAAPVEKTQPVIQPEIVDKIVERARFGMNAEGAHEFQIDLKQDVYAGSQLKIATKDGKVSVEVIADNPEVAASFEAKAQEIAKSLSDRGLNVSGVNVSVKTTGAQQQAPRDGTAGAGGSKARQQALDNQRGSGRDYSA